MTAAEIIFSELDRPEYKSGKSDLFVPWGHRKREPTIKPTALKWRSLSSQLIVQKSYSSLLGGAKQNSNGDDDASASSGKFKEYTHPCCLIGFLKVTGKSAGNYFEQGRI